MTSVPSARTKPAGLVPAEHSAHDSGMAAQSLRFRLGPFPVTVEPSFFIISVLLALSRIDHPLSLVSWVLVVFVSVLWHELGHAAAFRIFGHAPSITLYSMGGLTHGGAGGRLTPLRSVTVSLAGPFFGFLLGGLVWGLERAAGPLPAGFAQVLVADLLWVNVGWGVVNLLPLWPLDGAQALKGGLELVMPGRAERLVLMISVATAALTGVVALSFGWIWGALVPAWLGVESWKRLQHGGR